MCTNPEHPNCFKNVPYNYGDGYWKLPSDEFRKCIQEAAPVSPGHPSRVRAAYRITLDRPPVPSEEDLALSYLKDDPARMKNFAWLLFNLDEFLFVK